MKLRKPILVTIILALVAAMTLFAVACGDDDAAKTYTMRFETYGGTEIEPITAVGGSMIFAPSDPEKSGSTFMGWYTDSKFGGEAVQIPNIMPNKNVTYYAKFDTPKTEYTVIYEYNKGQVPHAKDIQSVTVEAGETVTVADGNDYGAVGYMFMGWSIYPNGLVTDVKQDGQYNAGDKITLTDKNVKLYAQWAVEYTDSRKENDDKIYVYEPLIDNGKGAAKLIRADKEKQDLYNGFVKSGSETTSGSTEFTFYADEFENGEFSGRLYADRTYATPDGKQGSYVRFDHVFGDTWTDYYLALDGFGYAVITHKVGDQLSVYASGEYEYDPEVGDYEFKFNTPRDDDDAKPQTTYFNILRQKVEGTDFDGYFVTIGAENIDYNGETYDYFNIDGYNWSLYLNGYGSATLTVYDDNDASKVTMTVSGEYYGTEYYESAQGEWQFEPLDENDDIDKDDYTFRFIIGFVRQSDGYYPVFRMCDETVAGEYVAEDESDKSTLYIDGYGAAQYKSNGVIYEGNYTVAENGVTTLVYTTEQDGQTVQSKMVFVLNGKKFTLSANGLIVSSGVLSQYTGESAVVVIPDTVTEIAADALSYSNENNSGVSLISVTVPDTVTTIGARAFENNTTLRRVIFLSNTPIDLDFSDANDPFRWAAGDFIIVVPQNDDVIAAYKNKWTKYADKIKGANDAAKLPEFEVKDGVLIRYNKPEDLEEGTLLDITIPDEVTEIADYVFSGVTGIKSVDLNNVTKVGDNAFYACADLETVKMTNVQSLGIMAFAACYNLNNSDSDEDGVLKLPAIEEIGESAFSGCESLRLVQLGEDIAEIGDFAFYQCNIFEEDPPLVVELLGDDVPVIGSKVTLGNIAFRFKIKDIGVALNCYKADTWSEYVRHLYIESGDEKGMYISGSDTLELDGRAIYQGSYVWMYAIKGEKITFYEYDSSSSSTTHYNTIEGKYKDGEISFALGSTMRRFVRIAQTMTYTSKDGNYTLVCNPMDLQPENYENSTGYADVKFNGKDVKLHIIGYNTKVIYEYEEDGKLYDIYIDFNGESLDVTKKLSDIRYSDIKAADGSKITILFRNGLIYIEKADFEIVVDEATGQKLYWEVNVVFAKQNGNVFTFSFNFRGTVYNFTVTVSEDHKTFTYTHTKA